MATGPLRSRTSTIDIYIKLAQYPILADKIRQRMREEIFRRGIMGEEDFEKEVEDRAFESQRREGSYDPFNPEPHGIWQERKARIRAYHTDFYFGNNLPAGLFEELVEDVLHGQRGGERPVLELGFNPELAPWDMLFEQGKIYEELPPPEQKKVSHHLEEIKVVLIKGMISDHLEFIRVAKKVFSIADLQSIYHRRIGRGKIGGKAAGMLLAWRMLQQQNPEFGGDISTQVDIPDSYFIATDVIYEFRRFNNLDHYMNQKYRPLDEIRLQYPQIMADHMQGELPDNIVQRLADVLEQMGERPIIVRSSSLLEDSFGYSFAGKYESYFCPNQGTPEENLNELLDAIRKVFASTLNPDAILYRQKKGLIDYDERMAVLLQGVEGQRHDDYFYPALAGVGFSQNPFRWNGKIRREDGFLRLVFGLGTRAVDRVDRDYPRMIALSHPQLRPETTAKAIRQYSQYFVDVVDLQDNCFKTVPVKDVLPHHQPILRYIASLDKGDYLQPITNLGPEDSLDDVVLTFDYLTKDRNFVKLMRNVLRRLEQGYGTPVDMEYAIRLIPGYPQPELKLILLQCRPLSQRADAGLVEIPQDIPDENLLFRGHYLIPDGKVEGIRYLIFVDPVMYNKVPSNTVRLELGRAVGRLNKRLEHELFVLLGPGRWGSSNIDLGVKVSYADIHNTKVLMEIAASDGQMVPDLSYGTHFFQDLVEGGIYSLPLHLDKGDSCFNWAFFRESPNRLAYLSPQDVELSDYLRVIDVTATVPNARVSILMNGAEDVAVGFISQGHWRAGPQQEVVVSSF